MSYPTRYLRPPKERPERFGNGRRRSSTRQDAAPWSENILSSPVAEKRRPSVPSDSLARAATSWLFDSRYSNAELPEAIDPESSTSRPRRECILQDQHRKSRRSDKIFVPAGEAPASTDEKTRPRIPWSATTLYTISHLVFYSILGTLARLGLEAITFYPSAPVISPVLWANVGGSFLMGFLSEDQRVFREEWGTSCLPEEWSFHPTTTESNDPEAIEQAILNHRKVKKTIPLFIGLATGFCGSFTSFSSFIRDAFLALSNGLPVPSLTDGPSSSLPSRHGGYSFEAVLAVLIIHIAASLSALKCGEHFALAIDPIMPTLSHKSMRTILDPLTVILGLGSWTAAIFLTAFPPQQHWRGRVTLALVFAPLGCLLRFYASKCLNPRIPSFLLGTFAVNILGTIVLGMCFDLQHSPSVASGMLGCQVLQGVMDGFCGSVTTVSTWVAELNGLKSRHGYLYGVTSVAVALLFLIAIVGSLQWSRGLETPVCA